MFQISIANLIIIVKKSCRWTYTFQFTFSTVHASAFVFIEVGMPKRFRPDLKKISNRNLIHFCSKSGRNLTTKIHFSSRNLISNIPNFPKIVKSMGGEQNLVDFAQISFRFLFKIFQICAPNLIQICPTFLLHHHLIKYWITFELCRNCTSNLNENLQDFYQISIRFLFQI